MEKRNEFSVGDRVQQPGMETMAGVVVSTFDDFIVVSWDVGGLTHEGNEEVVKVKEVKNGKK